ncbi:isocitrate lyase/phosphoenolpyruvate mutase family protein [Dermatophilaceae bacterium Soc4.6]
MGTLLPDPAAPTGSPSAARRRLRELIAAPTPLVAPGAYDALSARLVEQAGFDVVYLTGFGATASLLGRPDVGLLGAAEMADQARRFVDAVDVPVVVDADTGYGNAVNVVRTMRMWEQAGVAGLHLEDQVTPKKCGHMSGKEVVPTAEMVGKIRAAVAARRDPDLVLIARTDAAAVEGLDAAIARARAYAEAGADVLFVEAPTSVADIERVARELAGVAPLVFNAAEGGRTPPLELERVAELGFSLVIYPIATLLAATAAVQTVLEAIKRDGTPRAVELPAFDDFTATVGLPEISELESRFGA